MASIVSCSPANWQLPSAQHDARQYWLADWHRQHSAISEHPYPLPSRFPVNQLDESLAHLEKKNNKTAKCLKYEISKFLSQGEVRLQADA